MAALLTRVSRRKGMSPCPVEPGNRKVTVPDHVLWVCPWIPQILSVGTVWLGLSDPLGDTL